jgi:UDP-N-acetylglucosamine 1-carboxyvinyltransferase
MRSLVESLGVQIEPVNNHTWKIQASQVRPADLDPDLCRRIRASILLAGPMVARAGELVLPPPGGDVIGRRRVDTHIIALRALGAQAEFDRSAKAFRFQQTRLSGANILLDEASVTATENAILAAVLAPGRTVLRNAASEPHIQELCRLNCLGAEIENWLDTIAKSGVVCTAANLPLGRITWKSSALSAIVKGNPSIVMLVQNIWI